MNPWQIKRFRDQLKTAADDAEQKAAEFMALPTPRRLMAQTWFGVATGLRDAQRMLGKSTYEPRYKSKQPEEDEVPF